VFTDLVALQAEYLKEADVPAEAEGYPAE